MDMRFAIINLENAILDLFKAHPELADDDDLRVDMFEGSTDLNYVLAQLVDMARQADSMAGAIKARRDELYARQGRYERKEEATRKLIQGVMEHANLRKVELPEATLSMRDIAPGPIISNEDELPEDCVVLVRKPIMAAIKERIKTGLAVPGVVMSNGKTSLTIRTK